MQKTKESWFVEKANRVIASWYRGNNKTLEENVSIALIASAQRERRRNSKSVIVTSDTVEDLDDLITRIGCLEKIADAAYKLISYNSTGLSKGYPKWGKYFGELEGAVHELRIMDDD